MAKSLRQIRKSRESTSDSSAPASTVFISPISHHFSRLKVLSLLLSYARACHVPPILFPADVLPCACLCTSPGETVPHTKLLFFLNHLLDFRLLLVADNQLVPDHREPAMRTQEEVVTMFILGLCSGREVSARHCKASCGQDQVPDASASAPASISGSKMPSPKSVMPLAPIHVLWKELGHWISTYSMAPLPHL